MARRIVLTMLALIGALLVTTVVPMGLITTGHERSSFQQDTMLSARALAGLAEDRLADRPPAGVAAVARALGQARQAGEEVRVYSASRRLVAGTGGAAVPAATLTSALQGRTVVDSRLDDRLRVTVPVLGDRDGSVVGAVVLSRSSVELEERVGVLWTWLAAVALAGLASAIGLGDVLYRGRDGRAPRARMAQIAGSKSSRRSLRLRAAGCLLPGRPLTRRLGTRPAN